LIAQHILKLIALPPLVIYKIASINQRFIAAFRRARYCLSRQRRVDRRVRMLANLFVPTEDGPALADALARFIEDQSLRNRLAKGARNHFLAEFDARGDASCLPQWHSSLLGYRRVEPEALGEGQIS